jgi:hypothetical protein
LRKNGSAISTYADVLSRSPRDDVPPEPTMKPSWLTGSGTSEMSSSRYSAPIAIAADRRPG